MFPRIFLLVAASMVLALARDTLANELKDYCSVHKFENLPVGLTFTKEVGQTEYANLGDFKAIHCCLRGYRSIEWYKDNRPYPWPGGESHFILYPESENQTIYTRETRISDGGRYSCQARNDTMRLVGEMTLRVIAKDSGYSVQPMTTFKPVSKKVPIGATVRLLCEAYFGKVNLPDAKKSVLWSKVGSNETLPTQGRISQNTVSRDDERIVGSYLNIQEIEFDDYGDYRCDVTNGVDSLPPMIAYVYRQEPEMMHGMNEGSWRKALLLSALMVVVLLSLVGFYLRFWLPITLMFRDRFAPIDENDGKDCDVLVCYHEKDVGLIVGILVPTLESRYNYTCATLELSHLSNNWALEIGPKAKTARSVVIVLSPSSLGNTWTDTSITTAYKQLTSLNTSAKRTMIALDGLPNSTAIAKTTRYGERADLGTVKVLQWCEAQGTSSAYKFWCNLRLRLPPVRPNKKRGQQSVAMIVQVENCNQSKARSRESLEVLV